MKRLFLILPLAASLAACAPPVRIGPPAPIITPGGPGHRPIPPRPRPDVLRPGSEPVAVYPYRPLTSAPDAGVPIGTASTTAEVPKASSATGGSGSVSATNGTTQFPSDPGTRGPAKVAKSPKAPTPPRVAYVPPPPPRSDLSPAAGALLRQAEQQRRTRNYVGAAATLERALGIQPEAPDIWNRLARVRVEQRRYAQAGYLAVRSNTLLGADQVALKRDNWAIIAAARQAAGDTAGARKARRHARGG